MILCALDPLEGVDVSGLMATTGLGRVAVSERVNDLVQVGLAVREMISDQVRATDLATGLVELVRTVSGESADRLTEQLRRDVPPREPVIDGPARG
jgi:hypothetical protein